MLCAHLLNLPDWWDTEEGLHWGVKCMGRVVSEETHLQVPWTQAISGFKVQKQLFELGIENTREPVPLPQNGSHLLERIGSH